jgi:hypothetical protein
MRLLPALLCVLGLALAPPALAQDKGARDKATAQDRAARIKAAEWAYDTPQQAALLQKQIAALAPQKKGASDIYVVGVAGWASQNVFRNELAGALAAAGKALPLDGGIVRLINSKETKDTIPLATRQNFAAAVRGVAGVMDKEEDVLFLFMTSHGDPTSFGLQLPGVLVGITPAGLTTLLDKEGIKNRVVIISACFSGIFVKPLANRNTIVMTAADAKSPSFGCADGRDWTYFGDALFHHSLKPGVDLKIVFDRARRLIAGWEKSQRFKPSNPQGYFGEELMKKLTPLIKAKGKAQAALQ